MSTIAARVGSRSRTIGSSARSSSSAGDPVDLARDGRGLEERQQPVDEVVVVEPPDPLAVEPLEPLAVEPGAALLDLVELEPLLDLVEREARPPPFPATSRGTRSS